MRGLGLKAALAIAIAHAARNMAPIPLTVIGIMLGHELLGAQFTATSMIGTIGLAGIIVRNSILLIDFVNHAKERGLPLHEAVIEAAAVHARPIALTGILLALALFGSDALQTLGVGSPALRIAGGPLAALTVQYVIDSCTAPGSQAEAMPKAIQAER